MKKIIATILLLVFCINPVCFAKERNATSGMSIEKKAQLEKILKPYEKKNMSIIENAEKEINYHDAIGYAINGSYKKGVRVKSKEVTIPLQDGDYAEWIMTDFNTQYAIEYHENGVSMGVVKIQKLDRKTTVFYEYRIIGNSSSKMAPLKHIMIAYNDNNRAAFIYNKNKLRCYQYQGQTYAIDLPNMPAISPVDMEQMKTSGDVARSNAGEALKTAGMVVAFAPLFLLLILTWDGTASWH